MRRGSLIYLVTALAGIFVIAAIARLGGTPSAAAQKKHAASQEAWLRGVSDGSTRVVDMTYAINGNLPAWPGDDRTFEAKVVATPEKDGYFARSFWTLEHYGTHLDAPAHFPPGKEYLDQIPVDHFFGPAVVIDVSDEVSKDPDYRLRVMRVEKWEALHGRIPDGCHRLVAHRVVVALAGPSALPEYGRKRRDALPGLFRRGCETFDRTRRRGTRH